MAHIQYQKGDIFESNAQVIVNPVNCKGVMAKYLYQLDIDVYFYIDEGDKEYQAENSTVV